jgi:hypothetical protein
LTLAQSAITVLTRLQLLDRISGLLDMLVASALA